MSEIDERVQMIKQRLIKNSDHLKNFLKKTLPIFADTRNGHRYDRINCVETLGEVEYQLYGLIRNYLVDVRYNILFIGFIGFIGPKNNVRDLIPYMVKYDPGDTTIHQVFKSF